MEACGSSHHWGRQLAALGHRVRLIPPQYIKPYVKRGKNDRVDAAAICEAAGRPDMRFVAMKSVTQQAEGLVAKLRETLVCQRTQLINTLRGHAAEFGLIAAKGTAHVGALLAAVAADPTLPEIAREMFALLGQQSGAMAVIRHANSPASKGATAWLRQLLHRRPRKLAAVALANKMARIAWALMTRGEDYHPAHRPAVAA